MKNSSIETDLIKEIDKAYADAASVYQEVWLHATEGYMDGVESIITDEEAEFLKAAFRVINVRGENISDYTREELFQVHSILISAICFNREDLIQNSGISLDFISKVEDELERLGVSFI